MCNTSKNGERVAGWYCMPASFFLFTLISGIIHANFARYYARNMIMLL